jgi:hypothetical protein
MPIYRCPECGNHGEPGVNIPSKSSFEIRGMMDGKHVFKWGSCGVGLLRRGLISNKLTRIPDSAWKEMDREWTSRFPTP